MRDIYMKSQEYLAELAKNDLQDNSITITKIAEKIERLKRINYATNRRKTKREWTTPNKYHRSRCESPFSSRVVVEISYNIQAAVDNKHNLVVATTP
jgi:hypothetical protein